MSITACGSSRSGAGSRVAADIRLRLGVYLGIWLQKRIQDNTVYGLANVCLFVIGLKLIYDGVTRFAALY
jgi:putative Ca2+/H+ antiporter (TMEM165/GDT1 family)